MGAIGPSQGRRLPAGLVVALITVRRIAVATLRALREVTVSKPTPITSRRGEGRWTRRMVLVGIAAVVLAVWCWFSTLAEETLFSTEGITIVVFAVLAMIAVLACHRQPIYGLRLMVVLLFAFTYANIHHAFDYLVGPNWLDVVPFWLLLGGLVTVFAVAEWYPLPVALFADVLVILAITWPHFYFVGGGFYGASWVASTAGLVGAVTLVGYVVQLARAGNEQRLHRDHRDVVGDHVVQFAGDPGSLAAGQVVGQHPLGSLAGGTVGPALLTGRARHRGHRHERDRRR